MSEIDQQIEKLNTECVTYDYSLIHSVEEGGFVYYDRRKRELMYCYGTCTYPVLSLSLKFKIDLLKHFPEILRELDEHKKELEEVKTDYLK